jgi:hypothetical protein
VVTRGKGEPNRIIGDFIAFVLQHFWGRIQTINIVPRG